MTRGRKGKLGAMLVAASMFAAANVGAAPVDVLAFKISDSATTASGNAIDAWQGWTNAGGFNESNAAAQLLIDNGLDYKNSFVDTQWGSVLGVRVAMYSGGVEKAYITFNPGADRNAFFTAANVTGSTYTDLGGSKNFFSIEGDSGINRHWFINNNYGGCGVDVGNWVVLDRSSSYPCGWETSRIDDLGSSDRGLLYSSQTTAENWNNATVGVADVFAVFVTVNAVPEPGSLALLGAGALLLAGFRFRQRT